MLQKAQNDFMGHAANVFTTGGYGPPTIRAGATFLLEYRTACLTNGNRHDVLQHLGASMGDRAGGYLR